MKNEIDTSVRLVDKQTVQAKNTHERRITRKGRAAMAEAGLANLTAFRAQQAGSPEEMAKHVTEFEAKLKTDLGAKLTAAQDATVLSAKVSYAVLLQGFNKLVRTRRFRRFDNAVETLARAQGNLRRALEGLGLLQIDPEVARQREQDARRIEATRIEASRPEPTPEEKAEAERLAGVKARNHAKWCEFLESRNPGEPPVDEQ